MGIASGAPIRIGISGTGFIARGLAALLAGDPARWRLGPVLTRRDPAQVAGFSGLQITRDPETMIAGCDIVVECSGHVAAARNVIAAALARTKPVLTMNTEFQVTLGAEFAASGMVFEAQGDQPGSIVALAHEVRLMGFAPLVYGAQKGFLNQTPTRADMLHWSAKQGISLQAVTAFTDGTKVQMEHALVADALRVGIARQGLLGPTAQNLTEGAAEIAHVARDRAMPLSDYVLLPGGGGEVFVLATHPAPPAALAYYKLGNGPHYLITRPFHLGHFEIPISLANLASGRPPLLRASNPARHSVAAIAKHDLPAGLHIPRAVGSFVMRGEALERDAVPGHAPIGLIENARLRRPLAAGQMAMMDDLEFAEPVAMAV
ncbi:MAG: hypothetical protein JJU42_06580 [Rhodobacteraceae bacterium]|nr:hypothetical protein [Paracoccaceae bacterium]